MIDGRLGQGEDEGVDPGSARLGEVTEEKLRQRKEERERLPEQKISLRDRLPEAFGKVGTGRKGSMGV